MKIQCPCGHTIPDGGENSPTKGHLIPDTLWSAFWDAIDKAIEDSGPSQADKEAACMSLRHMKLARTMWQCPACGRLFANTPSDRLEVYAPEHDNGARNILATTD